VVRGSSMATMDCFIHLVSVQAGSRMYEVNGKTYGVAIYGLGDMLIHQNS
jgi:hypothetical protein